MTARPHSIVARMRPRVTRHLPYSCHEQGSISLLSLGFALVAIALILTGASVTALHVERTRLAQVADEVALHAADAMDVAAYYAGDAPRPTDEAALGLSQSRVRAAAQAHTARAAERLGLEQAQLMSVDVTDGHTVTVTVSAVVHPLFGVEALIPWAHGVTITATASARVY